MDHSSVKTGIHSFPSRDIKEDEKNLPEYSLEYCKAIYSRYMNDRCGIAYSSRENIDMIRLYGDGDQPTSIYKSFYQQRYNTESDDSATSSNRDEKTREGWENIADRVISPLPRIQNVISGYLDNVGQDVFVDAIDPLSNDMKQNMKWRMYAVAQNIDFINEYHIKAGIPQEELEFLPVSEMELNLYEAMGGFKMNYARVMEQVIKHTEKISDLDDSLKEKWIRDYTDLKAIAGRVIYDPDIKKYVYKYVDPKYLVIQYVPDGEYMRSEWAGYVTPYTISELKQIMPDKEEDFFRGIAYTYRNRLGNRGSNIESEADWDNYIKKTRTGSYNYDDFLVQVLDCEWIDYEAQRHLAYTNKYGHKTVKKLGKDSVVKLTENQKKRGSKDMKTKMRKLRGAKWIIDTDIVFDEGLVNMADRPKLTEVMHSFRLYAGRGISITEQLVPIADDMALAWYRWQDDRATMVRAGHSIDAGMMDNINMGGEDDWSFLNVLKYWRKTRILLHQQSLSGKYEGGGITPIQPIESQLLNALQEFITTWEAALKRIEDVTGINLVMLGATAPEGSQVRTTQMSIQGAVHVLKPTIKTIGRMKKELAETLLRRLQIAFRARNDIAKGYEDVVGKADVELLRMAEKDAVQYGMFFEDKPGEEMKQNIIAAATASLQARRDGKPGIDLSQFVYITQQLEAGGNIKELSALLDYLNAKAEQKLEQREKENIQLQGQQNQQLVQQQGQNEAEKARREFQKEYMLEQEKTKRDWGTEKLKQGQAPNTPANAPQSPLEPVSPQSGPQVPPGQ